MWMNRATPEQLRSVVIPLTEAPQHKKERPGTRSGDSSGTSSSSSSVANEETPLMGSSQHEYSLESLRAMTRHGATQSPTLYEMRAKVVNKAMEDVGMGRYNWAMFILCGFGWMADNLWLQGISLTLPSLSAEFDVPEKTVRLTTSWLFGGLCVGSFLWGAGSDVYGRRPAFNSTLPITAMCGMAAALLAKSWPAVCVCYTLLGFGVGGNLPVDGTFFLEFIPDSQSSLLTLLSVWWPLGQFTSSLVAWYCITQWPADQGWRMFLVVIALLTWVMAGLRSFIIELRESPKSLLAQGNTKGAVEAVQMIAFHNGTKTWLSEEVLNAVALADDESQEAVIEPQTTIWSTVKARVSEISGAQLEGLFHTRVLGITTILIWITWASIGLGYPLFNAFLPQYFSHGPDNDSTSFAASSSPGIKDDAYRKYAITSMMGVPGSILSAYLVDRPSPFLGRRGTLAVSTAASATLLLMFVKFPAHQLFVSCLAAFTQNIMYAVLYAFTPEIFPAPVRGAGSGMANFFNRATGLLAPIIASNVPSDGASTEVYLASGLIFFAFVTICMIPMETRGMELL